MEWRSYPKYSNYKFNQLGECYSILRGIILKPRIKKNGYVQYSINGKDKLAHRIIATLFLGEAPTAKHEVNHKDGIKINNNYSNLEWVTKKENIRHSINNLGRSFEYNLGSKNKLTNLKEEDVIKIKRLLKKGFTHSQIATSFPCSRSTITNISNNKTWKHIN